MDADGSSKRSRPVRRTTKKLKFKPKVPPQKPKKLITEKPQHEEPKAVDEQLMKILRVIGYPNVVLMSNNIFIVFLGWGKISTSVLWPNFCFFFSFHTRQVAAKTSPNTKDERSTHNPPSTPPSAAVATLSPPQSGVHKQNQSKALQIPKAFPVTINPGMFFNEESDDDDDNDNAKFQETQPSSTECEASTRPAKELGLLQEQNSKERMFLFQLPKSLPLPRKTSVVERKGNATRNEVKEGSNLQQLPQGHLGKMLVYKSGKIKMKIGDVM